MRLQTARLEAVLPDGSTRATLLGVVGWLGAALVSVAAAVAIAGTDGGQERIARFLEGPSVVTTVAADGGQDPVLRDLAAERDRLASRVAALERTLGDITGSIPRGPASAGSASPSIAPPAVALPPITARPPVATTETGAESTLTRTEFGVDLGGDVSLEGVRALWGSLRSSNGAAFERLRPVVTIREGERAGSVELRLVAGPFPNAGGAARLCATLTASGHFCTPVVFDGQRLALR